MTMAYADRSRKGQSAIEYLTTYGWMLLVVAIVGGAIFTTVQGQTDIQSTSGLSNADVQVSNFGIVVQNGNETLAVELRGAASQQVEITNVNISVQDGSNWQEANETANGNEVAVPVGETSTFTFNDIERKESSNTHNIAITYNTGGLEGLQVSGTLSGQLGFK